MYVLTVSLPLKLCRRWGERGNPPICMLTCVRRSRCFVLVCPVVTCLVGQAFVCIYNSLLDLTLRCFNLD